MHLNLEIEYNEKLKMIDFKNITFMNHPLEENFCISSFESFLLLANICASKIMSEIIDNELIEESLEAIFGGAAVVAYLALELPIIQEFIEQIIQEFNQLEKLSTNRKIMYCTFLELCKDNLINYENTVSQIISTFYRSHQQEIDSLLQEFDTDDASFLFYSFKEEMKKFYG